MKKNTMMRIASVLLIAVLITTCAISGTFAKYVSTANGTGTAQVAAWEFTLNGGSDNIADINHNAFTIDLFNDTKVFDTDGNAEETDVAASRIAPGTWGYFDIVLTNASEVNATYSINYEVAKNNAASGLNIKFVTSTTAVDTLPGTGLGDAILDVSDVALEMGDSTTIRVFWTWAYETADQDDEETALGVLAAAGATIPSVTVTAAITVTQAD